MPVTRLVPMCDIDEPANPMRSEMNDAKMQELMASIKANGLQQPIGLRTKAGRYEVIWGHRRYIAHKFLGLHEIEAKVYGQEEKVGVAQMFAENFHREDVNDADCATWMADCVTNFGYTEERLMAETGKSADWIGERFRLLRGDPEVFAALQREEITFAVARELNKQKSDKYRAAYLIQARDLQASSRQVAVWNANTPNEDANGAAAASQTDTPATPSPQDAYVLQCVWCSETYAPFNMDTVQIHKWCRIELQKVLTQAVVQGET